MKNSEAAGPDSSYYDLIVVGGGPAGTTLASLVAKAGHKVLLLEKDHFPRYQIGESLLPATIRGIGSLLGIQDDIKRAGFYKKLGGTFRWGIEKDLWTFNFGNSNVLGDPADNFRVSSLQVERTVFDRILLENARRLGVEIRQGCRVQRLIETDGRAAGVVFVNESGSSEEVSARYVGDASGHQSAIADEIGARVYSRFYRNVAVFGYFENGKRLPIPNDGNVFFESFSEGWIWYIPLTPSLTSVGAVVPKENSLLKKTAAEALEAYLGACPKTTELLRGARRAVQKPYDEVRIRKEFSYCQSSFWRPGAFLIGDSACFVDVLMSSGVHLGTYGALLAARCVNTGLSADRTLSETQCFDEFELRYRLEFSKFYQALVGMYDFTKTGEVYRKWLRSLLSQTNAGALEAGPLPSEKTGTATLTGAQNPAVGLAAMKAFNMRILENSNLEARMEKVEEIPYARLALQSSPDRLHWACPI